MTTIDVLVKNAPSRNLVSEPKPPGAPPDPYAAGCPTRMLLDRIGDKWMVLTLSLIRDKPRRFNALRRDIEGVTQKMLWARDHIADVLAARRRYDGNGRC